MFIRTKYSGCNRHGEQVAAGDYLILADHTRASEGLKYAVRDDMLYACVRYVRLRQCGHFMMGSTRIGPLKYVCSGNYGNDGLTGLSYDEMPADVQKHFVRVPDDIARAFWHDETDHAGYGSATERLRKWAQRQFQRDPRNPRRFLSVAWGTHDA